MSTNDEVQVAFVDLRIESQRPEDADEFIKFAAEKDSRFKAAVANASGMVKPWNILLVDTPDGLHQHQNFFESLARSFYNFNLLLVLDAASQTDDELIKLNLPEVFSGFAARMKFVLVTNHAGVMWKAGGIVPSGVALWDKDPDGRLSIGLVCDVLRDTSVFDELFNHMQERSAQVWALGTRQVWLGKLSGELTQDAFVGVGGDVVGEGRLGKNEFRPWDEPEFFIGKGKEPDVIMPGKELASRFDQAKSIFADLSASLGLTTRKNRLDRVANTPQRQVPKAKALGEACLLAIEAVRDLSVSIDPTNGFDRLEIGKLRDRGLDLRVVPARVDLAQEENGFVEGLLHRVRSSVEDGHTIETLIYEVGETAKRIQPRSVEVITEELSSLSTSVEVGVETLSSASEKPPSGLTFRLGRRVARLLRRPVIRYVALFLYIWALSAGLYEIFFNGDGHGLIPWPDYVRETLHLAALTVCVLLMVIAAVAGSLLWAADLKIREWGIRHKLDQLKNTLEAMHRGLADVAANDWACFEVRARVHEQMVALEGVLDVVSLGIKEGFIAPFRDVAVEELSSEHPNPMVRLDLNAQIQGHAFKHMSPLKEIIQIDVASMITKSLEHIYALRAHYGRQQVKGRVGADLKDALDRYVQDSKRFGLLFEHLSTSNQTAGLRRDLARQIWEEPGLVDEPVRNVVLMNSPVELVTFVSAEHLKLLATDESDSTEIRFFPSYAQSRLAAVSHQIGYHPTITVTESMSAAGIIRITPFKENVVSFQDS